MSASVRIGHHEPHFRCQFTFVVDGKPFEGACELVTDGREVTHRVRGRLTVSTLLWDGDALVSTDRSEERLDSATNCSMRDIAFE